MQLAVFWSFALFMLVFGLAVVVNRNPVASALSLVLSFLGLAALFVTLDGYFIGIIQVLVYAGAVMVLFLFIIMLLDLRAEEIRRINWVATAGGGLVALVFLIQVFVVLGRLPDAGKPFPRLASGHTDDVRNIGRLLFTHYNFPFQLIAILVLVATIGVVVLSRRERLNER